MAFLCVTLEKSKETIQIVENWTQLISYVFVLKKSNSILRQLFQFSIWSLIHHEIGDNSKVMQVKNSMNSFMENHFHEKKTWWVRKETLEGGLTEFWVSLFSDKCQQKSTSVRHWCSGGNNYISVVNKHWIPTASLNFFLFVSLFIFLSI
jgi:hypothetical protein